MAKTRLRKKQKAAIELSKILPSAGNLNNIEAAAVKDSLPIRGFIAMQTRSAMDSEAEERRHAWFGRPLQHYNPEYTAHRLARIARGGD